MDSSKISEDSIPFPSMDDLPEMVVDSSSSPTPEPLMIESVSTAGSPVESHNTTSSKLTSSDKLSALPPTNTNPNLSFHRAARPGSTFTTANNFKRGWRRSLDASTSVPNTTAADFDLPTLSYSWGAPHNIIYTARHEPHPLLYQRQSTPDHGSSGKETPRQRVSVESDRVSLPTMRSVGQAISRIARSSDPPPPSSPPLRESPFQDHHGREESNQHLNSRSPSQSKSRAASPLRMLHQWSSGLHRGNRNPTEEPFIPVDPFKFGRFPFCGPSSRRDRHDIEAGGSALSGAYDCDDVFPVDSLRSFYKDAHVFITDILPRELYLNFLLRLPAMYFSRVARIFEDADVSRPDIQRMINATCGSARDSRPHPHPSIVGETSIWEPNMMGQSTHQHTHGQQTPHAHAGATATLSPGAISGIGLSAQVSAAPAAALMHTPLPFPDEWTPAVVSPALIRFKHSWEAFIDSLLREWKTLNVVSALLASAILTTFQIPEAANDPLTRTFALLSLICALMSLSYGCIYIVRFGTMRSMFHASRWAEEAQKTKTLIWWNVWVLLATPAIWMAWAMLLFLSSILLFVWRTGSVSDPEDRPRLGARAVLGPRIAITSVFVLGMIDLALIIRTLRSYGSQQNSVRALIQAGSGGRVVDVPDNSKRGPNREKKTKQEAVEVVMERRGRSRERSTSTRIRHREDDVEIKQWKSRRSSTPVDRDPKVGGLRDLLGFVGPRKVLHDGRQEIELQTAMDSKTFENVDKNVVRQ